MKSKIPFNKPFMVGKELYYIAQSVLSGQIAGDGLYTKKCHALMEEKLGAKKVLLTTSCTAALEMSAMLCEVGPEDEIIVPSYTFPSTVNSFIMRGAKPVFVDIRTDTLNIDENKIEEKISGKTKAIIPVHYAGVSCEMDKILQLAEKYNLFVIEDAAQGIGSKYKGKDLGTIGHFGAYSFHETKNFICGEGGALIVNEDKFIKRAEVIREKGTNRSQYFRGEVDKYTWCDIGSSYLPSDILAAFLYAQLEHFDQIKEKRKKIFNYYQKNLEDMERTGKIRLPNIPSGCDCNYHMFYIVLNSQEERNRTIESMKRAGILTVFHYIPLHTSPMGMKFGYRRGDLPITEDISKRLLRLPLYNDMTIDELSFVINKLREILHS